MNGRLRIAFLVSLGFGVVSVVFVALRPREPVYPAKSFNALLDDFASGFDNAKPESIAAIRAMGTNALPFLLKSIRNEKSNLDRMFIELSKRQSLVRFDSLVDYSRGVRAAYALWALGPEATSAIPVLTNLLEDGSNYVTSAVALAGVGDLGIPHLLHALANTNSRIRMGAAVGLAHARTNFEQVVPALVNSLQDTDRLVRCHAADALGQLRVLPSKSIPALVESLNDSDALVRSSAAMALGLFGTKATNAVPALSNLSKDAEPSVRDAVEWALKQIQE